MALKTNVNLRNKLIYQVFPRQYSKTHDFKGVTKDLDRIKELGTDILYLLPISEIGKVAQKGSMGCPYSIYDYRKINPDLGTLADFLELINEAHKRQMQVIIDIVFNHTSRDSVLTKTHPEWFYHHEDGTFANRVGDWSDVTDFNYQHQEQIDYLIETLCYYLELGVDGFRCDVAPLISQKFWAVAITETAKINPNCLWLSESVHLNFIKEIRDMGYEAMSDSETFTYFDMLYDYDIFPVWQDYQAGKTTLKHYLNEVIRQESVYPKNYVKIRYLENHDMPRAASYIPNLTNLLNATAFIFFLKGPTFIYAGQEALDANLPSLFEIDEVNWEKYNEGKIVNIIQTLAKLKKDEIFATGLWKASDLNEDTALLSFENKIKKIMGIFQLKENKNLVKLDLPDGKYLNLLNNQEIEIKNNLLLTNNYPVIIQITK